METDELRIIERLTGVKADRIKLADDGFLSRGYVIDNGKIVFKFKKSPEVSYRTEIEMLNFLQTLDLGVNLQKVGWVSPEDAYLGVYGVVGDSLEKVQFDAASVGGQLARALNKLHRTEMPGAERVSLDDEVTAWQDRYQNAREALGEYFSGDEIRKLDDFIMQEISEKLRSLGEKLVFSHGDLGDGNVFVNQDGKVGIIDFSEMCYLDEAADFMDVSSDELREVMLDAYRADNALREKVRLRVLVRPLFVFGGYAKRGDRQKVEELVSKMKKLVNEKI